VGTSFHEHLQRLQEGLTRHVHALYDDRLVSLVVFGSVGRGTPRHDSDLDVLIVAEGLPNGRIARVEEFAAVEEALIPIITDGRRAGFFTECSPVFKTPTELRTGSPLLLDMVDDARVLFDREGFFASAMTRLRERLATLGARRVWRGNAWFWDLKPDYQPGDVFEL
jgi:predicted nucleotidyltransferase